LKGFFASDPHVYAVLDMFRNAGQNAGITAALVQARGSAFVLMDSDLQLLPEELPLLIEQYDQGYDLVTGYRVNRKDPLFRIIPVASCQHDHAARFSKQHSRIRLHLQNLQCRFVAGV